MEAAEALGQPASHDPDAICADIETTRSDLSRDVNALGEVASSGSMAKHQTSQAVRKLKGAVTQAKERLTSSGLRQHQSGYSTPTTDSSSGLGARTLEKAHEMGRRAQGNPMAVGLIALGMGWLLGRAFPSARRGSKGPRR